MTPDTAPLDERRCLHLLAGAPVGRIVYTVGALPAVLPTRYRLDDDGSVVLQATAGSEFHRAVAGALVAFHADEVSSADGSGWSVTVLGTAEATGEGAATRATATPPAGQVTIRIHPEWVTGRLLPAAPAPHD
ncbi:pyridoxamine 5'-phosphate oxidase family protein [Kitasatospora sp. RG8]|uniref:pyridoxamine 5'-phosphate oxidase family protein n=1 Tax=Kitasatospora sp. RG8 TaxID=2820815 RepID=UPI001AE06BB7|nr:pyridoxamine 5'-phosphate oxidase family protein [Kitasatospora sp. RG8]MBP0450548.1 pyridoxamine 5'-phosphate oxidase family protein [Kitasatospora sp. RG8]